MQIKQMHPNFQMPERSSELAGGYDMFMPEAGEVQASDKTAVIGLGFAAAVPEGYVALILPRSGAGSKRGFSLRNTVGVIDADYRGEWMVAASNREQWKDLEWDAGERVYQFILVAVASPELELVDELTTTFRGTGGFGSTGQ